MNMAATSPEHSARVVLTATSEATLGESEDKIARAEPGLKPYQLNQRQKVKKGKS
jgi:hypothetical protein